MKWTEVKVPQSCPTLCDPIDYTVHGILQARILEWVAVPFSMGSSHIQGLNPGLLHCRQILYPLSHKYKWNNDILVNSSKAQLIQILRCNDDNLLPGNKKLVDYTHKSSRNSRERVGFQLYGINRNEIFFLLLCNFRFPHKYSPISSF